MDAFIHKVTGVLTHKEVSRVTKISGTVVIVKSNVVGFNDFVDSFLDGLHELVGSGITFQLISATAGDPKNGNNGKLGKPAQLERWITTGTFLAAGDSGFKLTFEWDEQLGVPGAVIVRNNHYGEFFLKSLTLDDVPGKKSGIHFDCNSWVYPYSTYNYDRVFFANDTFLPGNTPEPLKAYRAAELANLRGEGVAPRELKEGDRIYAYDVYNDLGDPDSGKELVRPILGGSKEYPYPRRARTGRKMTKTDPKSETRLPLLFSLNVYVPRDERFGHLKMSDFLGYSLKALAQGLVPVLNEAADLTPFEFDTYQDVLNLYEGGIDLPDSPALENVRKQIPFALIKELFRSDGENLFRLPTPAIIKADKFAWRTDEEFGREMLAGVNPVCIRLLTKFPPVSSLDPNTYGNHNSTMTADQLEKNMNGLSVEEALKQKKLFILDHHDSLMPYLERINTFNKIYASRTVLLLQDDGTLKPLAIELSLPIKGQKGAVSKVYTPAEHGVEAAVWQLAKAYAAVNDSGVHQLISHWLNTHATIEPFAIALNRQLSVVHPIYKLLHPHFRDTMNINAFARQILINAGGILEMTVFPGKYALEMSSVVYKGWKLTDHALPVDLLNRGVAENDPSSPGKLRLLIEDYPYAVDGLAVWSAIEIWVKEYCAIYYPSDKTLQDDTELQAWWKEVREVGHGDKKDETWWPTMKTVAELAQTCCTIIWVASALHAAVNFGQYPYAGYLPNRPTVSRRFMPEPGTPEYEELRNDPDRAFLKTITSQLQTTIGVSLIEILSRHSSDEVYLGQRISAEWTTDNKALAAFKAFGERLITIENQIIEMNHNPKLKNRNGPVKLPYMLLYPNTSDYTRVGGLTGRGIPNSVSI